jgi:hypothetical protein
MELLPVELIDKILFPKNYKCNEELTLTEKLCLSLNLQNKITVANQIKHLVKEFEYQRNRSDYNVWRKSKQPIFMYILYQSLSKKNNENRLDLRRNNYLEIIFGNHYNTTNRIINNYKYNIITY